ncbi:MAG: VWA domain-containing protein [Planctomycetota bacterium]|nr:VWA domain-containing protein [Planctomycetota bacterium]MCX8003950.1 VWA domain-containing protein [Burkholderiaceae bacterium]MDW8373878.1 VWA domain-containing protein [Planctomycetota bacterium]
MSQTDLQPILLEVSASPAAVVCDGSEQDVAILVSVRPSDALRASPEATRIGTDLCLVLDCSGSMEKPCGNASRLEVAVQAARAILPLLRPQDTISVVSFSGDARVLLATATPADPQQALAALEGLSPSFETAIGQGLTTAVRVLAACDARRHRRIVLLTDGHATDGEAGLEAAALAAQQGIVIDALGIGDDYHKIYLERLVAPGKGRSAPIASAEDAVAAFRNLAILATQAVATNVQLQIEFSPDVRAADHYRGAPENLYLGMVRYPTAARRIEIPLGAIERDQRYDYYFVVRVPAPTDAGGQLRLARFAIACDVPAWNRSGVMTSANAVVDLVEPGTIVAHDSRIEVGLARARIKRWEREADEARQRGDAATAVARYRQAIELCHRQGMYAEEQNYQAILDSYLATGTVDQALLNRAAHSSTKAADAGILPMAASGPRHNPFAARRAHSATRGGPS